MDDDEIVTRGILRTELAIELAAALAVAFDDFALIIGGSFQRLEGKINLLASDVRALEERVDGIERHITERIDGVEKHIVAMHDLFDSIFSEIREIRYQLKEIDSRSDVVDLQVRVSDLEQKVGIPKKPKH